MINNTIVEVAAYRLLWKQPIGEGAVLPPDYPGWPESGFAVLGDFSGIQDFVFRPVPGAGGAARRLRSRSFRVSAYAELVMRRCLENLSSGQPETLYVAGGRFLVAVKAFEGFQSDFTRMQAEVDDWAWRSFSGELIFHLAAVPFNGGKIPHLELQRAMESARSRPLRNALVSGSSWSEENFFQAAAPGDGKCDACGITRPLHPHSDSEEICSACQSDERVGAKLPSGGWAFISPRASPDVSALGANMQIFAARTQATGGDWLAFETKGHGAKRWQILHHVPTENGEVLDFDKIAQRSPGPRKWLGYLRIDGDGAGRHFADLEGDPLRSWALSRLLNSFFVDAANRLLSKDFGNIYPVYGGGDDLFLVGAWNETLDFALTLRKEFIAAVNDDLTFSAGLSLSKPKEHVLTQATLALKELERAKQEPGYGRVSGRGQIRALGVTVDWKIFCELLPAAKQVTLWVEQKQIPRSFLHQLLQLHNYWRRCAEEAKGRITARAVRYKPLLYYQLHRNLVPGAARSWLRNLLRDSSLWPWANFIASYALLAAKSETDKE